MEQRKVNAKDIFLLLGAIGAMIGVYFGVQIIGVIVVMIYLMIVQGCGLEEVMSLLNSPNITMGIVCMVQLSFIVIFGVWYKFGFVKKEKIPFKQVYSLRNVVCFVVLGGGLQICCGYILSLANVLFPTVMEQYKVLLENANFGINWIAIIASAFFAPIGEELVFRGVIMKYARRVMPFIWANLLQAVLFGIYHMNVVQGVYTFVIGLLFGYLVKKCDSLLPTITVHFVLNVFANVISLFSSGMSEAASTEHTAIIPSLIISVISVTICAVSCYFVKGKQVDELKN